MNPLQEKTLAALYDLAIAMTDQSASLLGDGRFEDAKALLAKRCLILRDINRHIGHAPAWGACAALDHAALSYIRADRDLERVIEAACAR